MYSFPNLEPVCCSMFSSNCCFLTCIQISLYASDPNVQLKLRPLIYSSREDLNYTPKNVIKSTVRNKSTLKLKRNPKLPTSVGSLKNQESSRKTSTSALLTMPKTLTVCITINCGNSSRDGNTRPPDLPPEKSELRSRSNS